MTSLGRNSVVGIATRYGLSGPGIEFQWKRRDFPQPSWPPLGPKHIFIEWEPDFSRG